MEYDTNTFSWANDAYHALSLSEMDGSTSMAPAAFSKTQTTLPPTAFNIAGLSANADVVKRFGQITPPEEMSPPGPAAASIHESPPQDAAWPSQMQQQQLEQPSADTQSLAAGRAAKRRRTTKQGSANESPAEPVQPQLQNPTPPQDPQPPKRKRGRPKSQPQVQPQTADALTAEGYPFPVSSARQSHLEKNRLAAHKCRQRRKEYIQGLETKARHNSATNKMLKEIVAGLREEVLDLKNVLLQHAGCGCWAIDEYLQRCAGDLLGVNPPTQSRTSTSAPSLFSDSPLKDEEQYSIRSASTPLQTFPEMEKSEDTDYNGLDMLKEFDDDVAQP